MAIVYRGAGDASTTYSGTSLTIDLPDTSLFDSGDVFIGFVAARGATSVTWPSGWTEIDSQIHEASSGVASVAYRVVASIADSAPTVTFSSSAALGGVVVYSGASEPTAQTKNAGGSGYSPTDETVSGFNSAADGAFALYLRAAIFNQEFTNSFPAPSGWTERIAFLQNSTPYYVKQRIEIGDKSLGSAGTASGTVSGDGGSVDVWALLQIELPEITTNEGDGSSTLGDISGSASGEGLLVQSDVQLGSISGSALGVHSTTTFDIDCDSGATLSSESVGVIARLVSANSAALASSSASSPITLVVLADSSVLAVHAASAYRLLDAAVDSNSALSSSAPVAAVYSVAAASLCSVLTGLQFVADFTDGWAYNLNTGAGSFYEGFRFNSFALIDGEYYGANEAGIFRLGGDADDSAPIDMTITLGTSNLGSSRVKRVPAAYVGAQSDQPLVLTCRVEGQEYRYTFSRATATMAPAKVQIGKGLAGVYWQLELSNTAGSDAEIDALELLVAHSDRRRV